MDRLEPLLAPMIVAFIVGAVAGSYGERWLLWRRLSDGVWVYRRLIWLGEEPKRAAQDAALFGSIARYLQLRNPLLVAMWLLHAHRRMIALLVLTIIASAGLAIYLK